MFPGQVASLEPVLMEFLQVAFGGTRDDPPALLRGVYFTSGTQEGTPIDRLTGTLARALGVDQTRTPTLQPIQGRSYFLERLLKEVIFGEALLVARGPTAARRRLVLRTAGYAVPAVLVVATSAVLWQAHRAGQREIDAASMALAGYEQTAGGLPLDPVADDDLARLAPLLDQARTLPRGSSEPPWLPAGLSQHEKLDASARVVYRHALEWALLPRLMWRLETQLRGNLNRPDFLYEATRVYLMLGNAGPLDASLVREWMKLDWESAYPGLGYAPLREALLRHLGALLAEPLPQVQLDGELVTAVRGRIATVPLAQRVYSRIRPSAAAQRLPEWRPADALGPAGVALFVRASGKPLTDGIPGFFTTDGFHKVLLPSLAGADEKRGGGKLGAWRSRGVRSERGAEAGGGTRRGHALRGGLRAGVGPDAGGPERGAASQPVAGGAGPLHPRLTGIADAKAAGLHQPAIDACRCRLVACRRPPEPDATGQQHAASSPGASRHIAIRDPDGPAAARP